MSKPDFWKNNKNYYDLKSYWRNLFGCNVHKLQIDAGFTCPNRDGHVAVGGCIYCDGRGSKLRQQGELPSVTEQIVQGKKYYTKQAAKFIAYFQTFTNTYAPVEKLRALYDEALAQDDVIGLSIGTRPDCLGPDVVELLSCYAKKYHVWVELGLQSVHDKTLQFINRGHNFQQFLDAMNALAGKDLNICVHIIIGLPGESDKDVLTTAKTLAALPVNGIKIHSLLALEGTTLGDMYKKGDVQMISREKYISLVADILEVLPPEMVIQRLTADGYRDIFLAPDWAMNKLDVLNTINKELERRDSYQGKHYIKG
ncbi:MAG TPA: TIGR01212 family radical SAM protein [Smithella sp.]|nr:TIGR01212 family radical SAM protein [Smithella sp.]HNY49416.1 TIGR01212 family radical SAM protein [Smithella sp.]HOG91285.1 TIGR01212 family radical SAM protein [Smithella sp.]HOU51854.1 TIGR01212 family radical SAM protein [Smithella sp.]HQO14267.1 TIGR01212 family radical SAM protein [Smithellaceae bacterium]